MPQRKSVPLNVYTSQMCFDPNIKDRNSGFTIMANPKDRQAKVVEMMNKYAGQVLHVVNLQSGQVRNWLIEGRAGRVHITHLLFGDWRFATAEDIARQDAKNKAELERVTKAEAKRLAVASGLVMKEMAGTATAIMQLNKMNEKPAPPEPTAEQKAVVAAEFSEIDAGIQLKKVEPKAPKKMGRPAKANTGVL